MSVKSVVLLSSGLDSTLNLYEAQKQGQVLLALTFDYGQRAAKKEIAQSEKICKLLGIDHKVMDMRWLGSLGASALTFDQNELPSGVDVQMDDLTQSQKTAKAVWVPNRNGLFLNIGACFAEALGADQIVPGFNVEEAATFPDNSQEFLDISSEAFKFSTASGVKAFCYTTDMNKTQMVKRGDELGLAFDLLWPCYRSEEDWCGECESCQRFKRAGGFERGRT